MENFIKTQDAELAKKLRAQGFKELKSQGRFFVFLNNSKATFAVDENKKLFYTDKLCM